MPRATYYQTSQEWLDNSILLIEAHPTTTRITTKYAIKPPRQPAAPDTPAKPPRGKLVLKTYDPSSGAALKYRTAKAAEVGRLVQVMGRLGRGMAGVAGAREALGEAAPVPEKVDESGGGEERREGKGAGAGGKRKKKGRK